MGALFYQRPDLRAGDGNSRGRVRIRQHDAAVRTGIILNVDPKSFVKGHNLVCNPVKDAIDRIETVGDIREKKGQLMLEQGVKCMGQDFVRTVAKKDMGFTKAVSFGNDLFELPSFRVRVKSQLRVSSALEGA